jgi:hypothetical protein
MAKPIFVIRVSVTDNADLIDNLALRMRQRLFDYHVLTVLSRNLSKHEVAFECYNDSSGLSDVDIQQLIDESHALMMGTLSENTSIGSLEPH